MATKHILEINNLVCGTQVLPTEGWAISAGLALLTSTMILMLLYLASILFKNEQFKAFIKFEFFELLATLALILVLVALVQGVCNLNVNAIIPTTGSFWSGLTIYEATQEYFIELERTFAAWMTMNYLINFHLDQMASVTPYSRPLGIGMVSAPLAGFASPFKQIAYNSMTGLAIAVIINDAMMLVYESALYAFLEFYLPIGIVLRSFTPTRRIGGTLIAMAIGFLLIFPMTIVISGVMFLDPTHGDTVAFRDQLMPYWTNADITGRASTYITNLTLDSFIEQLWDFIAGGFLGAIGELISMMIGTFITALFLIPLSTIAKAFAVGYVMPAFNILILVQTVKHLSKSIGEEIDITSLTRMI